MGESSTGKGQNAGRVGKIRSLRTRALSSAFCLTIALGGLGISPATADEPVVETETSTVLPDGCQSVLSDLSETDAIQDALEQSGTDETAFTCVGDVATVEVQDENGDPLATMVMSESEGEVIDLTGLTQEESAEIAPTIESGIVEEVEPAEDASSDGIMAARSSTINHQYRGSVTDDIYWGTSVNGKPVWKERVSINSWISLGQMNYHPVHVGYTAGRSIDMTIPTRFRKHLRALPDPAFEPITYSPFSPQEVWGLTDYMQVSGAGKFYVEQYGMSVYDTVAKKTFKIASNITGPRFQCYKTVVCKYPNGKIAPY